MKRPKRIFGPKCFSFILCLDLSLCRTCVRNGR